MRHQGADGKEVAVASLHSLVSSSQPEVHAAALEVVSSVLAVAEEHANDGPLSLASEVVCGVVPNCHSIPSGLIARLDSRSDA
eukprot:896942-Amphidinium_carterae.1